MLLRKLSALFRRRRLEDELEEEMRVHRDLAAVANRSFGNLTLLKEQSIDMWRLNWVEEITKDARFALRWMRARPLFTAITVLTLALGVGANTAIFSLANALLLRMLPARDAAELHYVHIVPGQPDGAGNTGSGDSSFSYASYRSLREQRSAFTDVVAYVPLGFNKIPIRVGNLAEEAAVQMVSGDFFSALGVRLTCGPGFRAADEDNGASLAVIGHGLWNRDFGGSCSALGRTVSIKGLPFTVVGVAPNDFRGVELGAATDVWVPLQKRLELNAWGVTAGANYRVAPRWWCLRLIARVPANLDPSQAERNALPGFLRIAYEPLGGKPHPGEQPRRLKLIDARGLGDPTLEKPIFTLMGMVGLVLVIACANIAMLLLARNSSRHREFGIRLALGGGQVRLFQQLLVESLLLVFGGASVGFLLAWRATGLLANWAGLETSVAPDVTVLLFTLGISVLIALLFGLIPFLTTTHASVTALLSRGSQATAFSGRSRGQSRQLVLASQVALGFALIVGAGLLTRSLRKLENRNLGFAAERLLAFGLNAPANASVGEKNALFFNSIVDRLKELPGVINATYVENRPGSTWSDNSNVWVDGSTDHKGSQNGSNMMRFNGVGPDYFRTAGIPVRQGRDISRADSHNAAKVVVVNEQFAKEFFPGRTPIGHDVSFTDKAAFTVVGVVADHVYADLHEQSQPMAWFPLAQTGIPALHVLLSTDLRHPETLVPQVRRAVASIDPNLALLQPRTEAAEYASTANNERLIARISLFFGLTAVVLVTTGLYGTLSYRVNRRTAELGIRMAVGAQKSQIVWLVVSESVAVLLIGLCVGIPLAVAEGRWLASLLYELKPNDLISFVAAGSGIVLVTLAASIIPAQRAASVNPIRALRHE